jgi:hypothetical protein
MKRPNRILNKHYLLSFYPSNGIEGDSLKILLCKGVTADAKKLSWKHLKKSLFALQSGPS